MGKWRVLERGVEVECSGRVFAISRWISIEENIGREGEGGVRVQVMVWFWI